MAPASLRALLSGLIDYAGLFPPAALPLDDVVRNYGTYRRSSDRWALGRLVVPAGQLSALVAMVATQTGPWPVSAIVSDDFGADAARIATTGEISDIVVQSAEVRAHSVADIRAAAGALYSVPELYVELPLTGDLEMLLKAVADVGARAKIRTGGVTADAMPSAAACARFIEACADIGVAFKATAGLHHPLRGRYALTYAPDAPRAEMFGFLNVFIAAAVARRGIRGADIEAILVEPDARAFALGDEDITWKSHTLTLDDIASTRKTFAMSFGSCSFREPIDDLTQLGLLTP